MPSVTLDPQFDINADERVKRAQALKDELGTLTSLNEKRAAQVRRVNDARRNLIESKKRGFLGKLVKGDEEQAETGLRNAEAVLREIDHQLEEFDWKAPALEAVLQEARTESEGLVAEKLVEHIRTHTHRLDELFSSVEQELTALQPLSVALHRNFSDVSAFGTFRWKKNARRTVIRGPLAGVTDYLQPGSNGELKTRIKIWRSHATDAGLLP